MSDFDVTRNMRIIDALKSDILSDLAALYKDMAGFGRKADFEDRFAGIVTAAYLLAARLGISFERLDDKAVSLLRLKLLENPEANADASRLLTFLNGRNET